MARTLIIGYGNPLRGDDAVGWFAAEQLAGIMRDYETDVFALQQLVPELADPISKAGLVVFIDASCEGKPGSWKCETVEQGAAFSHALGHHLTPTGLLAYAQAVFNSSPRALIVSVAGGSFDCGEKLTPPVAAALHEVVRHVCEQIQQQPESTHA